MTIEMASLLDGNCATIALLDDVSCLILKKVSAGLKIAWPRKKRDQEEENELIAMT